VCSPMEGRWPVAVINMHTVFGGAVGIVAMFVPWVVKNGTDRYSLIDILNGSTGIGMSLDFLLPLIGMIFLLGAVTVFISPYGATAQIGGASIALFTINIAALGNSETQTIAVGLGPYIGLVSAAIVFLSIVFPFGIGHGHWKPLGNRGRNYTFSFYLDLNDSDGMPYWWWATGPGWFWYWWFEMKMGWAFRDALEQHQKRRADRIVRNSAVRELDAPDSESRGLDEYRR